MHSQRVALIENKYCETKVRKKKKEKSAHYPDTIS